MPRRHLKCSVRTTRCPRAPCWWPLLQTSAHAAKPEQMTNKGKYEESSSNLFDPLTHMGPFGPSNIKSCSLIWHVRFNMDLVTKRTQLDFIWHKGCNKKSSWFHLAHKVHLDQVTISSFIWPIRLNMDQVTQFSMFIWPVRFNMDHVTKKQLHFIFCCYTSQLPL